MRIASTVSGLIGILLCTQSVQGQSFGQSLSCNINVNDPAYLNQLRKPVIDATFKWGGCTGTLINRPVSDYGQGLYSLTSSLTGLFATHRPIEDRTKVLKLF